MLKFVHDINYRFQLVLTLIFTDTQIAATVRTMKQRHGQGGQGLNSFT